MHKTRIAVVTGTAVLTLIVPAASVAAPRPPAAAGAVHYTPLVASLQAPPHPVAAADGRVHLVYELLLLNPLPAPITVSRLEVLDAAHPDRVLADLRGAALDAALTRVGEGGPGAAAPGQSLRAILDVRLPAAARPRALVHRITVADAPDPILANPFLAGRAAVPTEAAVVLAPPLRGAGWIDVAGCCDPAEHRASLEPLNGALRLGQRFAVDLPRIGPDRRFYTGPADQVSSYYGYGAPVLAAAAGVVVVAQDRFPDQIPFQATPPGEPETIAGNSVIVDLGDGRYAGYAHLKPGSVRVRAGDRVRTGQTIAQVGNSGNSDLPHLHFQVMDAPSILDSEGLPFVLDAYDSPGSIPPTGEIDPTQPLPVRPVLTGHFTRVLPMSLQVMDF